MNFRSKKELNMVFINAIDQDKYADSFDSISVLVLAQILTRWHMRKKQKRKAFLSINKTTLNSQIVCKFLLFSLIESFSTSNFHTCNFVLKFHAFVSLILSRSSTKNRLFKQSKQKPLEILTVSRHYLCRT